MQHISSHDFIQIAQSQTPILIDVRAESEYQHEFLPCSENIPLSKIEQGKHQPLSKDEPVYLICRSGTRSQMAGRVLENKGYHNIISVDGGIQACKKQSNLVVTHKKVLPLMQQVQIGAGTLILLGLILAHLIHPYWMALTAFVGLGLTFAGLTGFCGMARLLLLMPWNKFTHCRKESS